MSEEPEQDPEVERLRRARPGQGDLVARQMAARVRSALVGADVEPVRMGRFVVLERLGAGGMGAVYAAFDPKLDRRVALKVLHAMHATGSPDAAGHERQRTRKDRVLREARALAKLTHPNVVAVYDASDEGGDGGELYIAMELVEGTNLRRWLAEVTPSEREIVATLLAAGRGLAAAHAAGLVHGDIKPENILVGDGVVKVADFGLARHERDPAVAGDSNLAQGSDGTFDHDGGTPADAGTPAVGGTPALGGTPGYMAPEQLAGAAADARTDQYAFAVTVHEALVGKRPGVGAITGKSGTDGALAGIAPRVARALQRALSPEPSVRFASMDELLGALAPPRSRRWQIAAAAGALVATAAVVFAMMRGESKDLCGGGDARVANAVPAGVRARLSPRAAALVDAHGRAWAAMARETCEATQRGEQSAAMLDLRMACLDRKLDELGALTTEVADLSRDEQIKAVHALSPLEPCADRERLADVLPAPAAQRPRIDALYKELARAAARQKTVDYKAAVAETAQLVGTARELGYAPATAHALNLLAKLQNHAGDREAAEATLKEATIVAAEARDDEVLAELWSMRIFVAAERGRPSDAIAYAEAAESVAARLSRPARARGAIRGYLGIVYAQTDRLAEARATLEDAVRQLELARGAKHPAVAETLASLADACSVQGDLVAARRYAERAIGIFEAAYGRDHQDTAVAAIQLAHLAVRAGKLEEALAIYRDVLERTLRAAGPDHLYTAVARHNLGDTLRKLGRRDEARRELEAARTIYARSGVDNEQSLNTLSSLAKLEADPVKRVPLLEDLLVRQTKVFGETSRKVADTINDLGNAAREHGDFTRATELFERALAGYEKTLGSRHPRVAIALSNLGDVAIETGKLAKAEAWCARALAIDEQALGKEHSDLAYDLTCLGEARLGRDRAAAVPLLERALALRTANKVSGNDLARTRFALARALPATARRRARELAVAARADAGERLRDAIDRWLAGRG